MREPLCARADEHMREIPLIALGLARTPGDEEAKRDHDTETRHRSNENKLSDR